jgi:hypothetical protein
MNELINEIKLSQMNNLKTDQKVRKNRYLFNFIKRLEELRELDIKRINDLLK